MKFCTLCRRAAPGGATICSYDGSPLSDDVVVEPEPGAEVGGYKLLDVVAHGDTGTVYRAESTSSHNAVAVKLLKPELTAVSAVMHRIRRETKNAVKLASANVVRVMDCGDHEGRFFIARERVEGHPLSVAIREEGPMALARAAAIAYQVCAGLALVHRVGLVHRDLKPNHIILSEVEPGAWGVKLIDIGIADKVTSVESQRDIYGTLAYLSPEQAEGKLVSFRSDLYSLGCVLYEMLTGRPPFAGDPQSIVEQQRGQEPAPVETLRPDVPPAFAQLVAKLLSKQASARPFSAAMVQRELEKLYPESKEPLGPVTTGKAPPQLSPAPAPAAAPPPQREDLGMAQTLFGGPSPIAPQQAAAAPAPSPTPPAAAPAPTASPMAPAASPGPAAAQAPVIAAGEPSASAVQPTAAPTPAQEPAPLPYQPGPGAAADGHKKTMLGFPVVAPPAQTAPGAPAQPSAPLAPGAPPAPDQAGGQAPQQVAGAQPGAYPPSQPAMQPQPMPDQGQMQPQPGVDPSFQQAMVAPETTADLEMPRNDAARWVLIILGILVVLGLLFGIASLTSYLVCAGSSPGLGDDGSPALVELWGDEHETDSSSTRR